MRSYEQKNNVYYRILNHESEAIAGESVFTYFAHHLLTGKKIKRTLALPTNLNIHTHILIDFYMLVNAWNVEGGSHWKYYVL